MKRQPKLILRESSVDDLSKDWPVGSFVEMGAGTGYMAKIFLNRGFSGACHDLGEDSRQMLRQNLAFAGDRIKVVDQLSELADESCDYLFAFEVLEHIEQDLVVLKDWLRYLKPEGRVLISVPAHQRKYGRQDEIVGHIRRYEKEALYSLLAAAGVDDIRVINYGFPITELTRRLSNFLIKNDRSYDNMTPEQRSIRSAQVKPKNVKRALSFMSENLFTPFQRVQRWFYNYDLGDGLVACGVKRKV